MTFLGALVLGLVQQLANVSWLWPGGQLFLRVQLAIPGLFLVLAVLLVPSFRLSAGRIVGRDQPRVPTLRGSLVTRPRCSWPSWRCSCRPDRQHLGTHVVQALVMAHRGPVARGGHRAVRADLVDPVPVPRRRRLRGRDGVRGRERLRDAARRAGLGRARGARGPPVGAAAGPAPGAEHVRDRARSAARSCSETPGSSGWPAWPWHVPTSSGGRRTPTRPSRCGARSCSSPSASSSAWCAGAGSVGSSPRIRDSELAAATLGAAGAVGQGGDLRLLGLHRRVRRRPLRRLRRHGRRHPVRSGEQPGHRAVRLRRRHHHRLRRRVWPASSSPPSPTRRPPTRTWPAWSSSSIAAAAIGLGSPARRDRRASSSRPSATRRMATARSPSASGAEHRAPTVASRSAQGDAVSPRDVSTGPDARRATGRGCEPSGSCSAWWSPGRSCREAPPAPSKRPPVPRSAATTARPPPPGCTPSTTPATCSPSRPPSTWGPPTRYATIASGPATYARASVLDPGDLLANPDALLALASSAYPGGVLPAYPYRVTVTSSSGPPTAEVSPAPGLDARVQANRERLHRPWPRPRPSRRPRWPRSARRPRRHDDADRRLERDGRTPSPRSATSTCSG